MTFRSNKIRPRTCKICSTKRTLTCILSRHQNAQCIAAATATTRDPTNTTRLSSVRETEAACTTTLQLKCNITCSPEDTLMRWLVKRSHPRKTRTPAATTTQPTWRTAWMRTMVSSWTIPLSHLLRTYPNKIITSRKIKKWTFQISSWRVISIRTSRQNAHHLHLSRKEHKSSEGAMTKRLQLSALMFKTTTLSKKCWIQWVSRDLAPNRTNSTTTTRDRWVMSKDWALESHKNHAIAAFMTEVVSLRTCSANITWRCRGSELSLSTWCTWMSIDTEWTLHSITTANSTPVLTPAPRRVAENQRYRVGQTIKETTCFQDREILRLRN